MLNKKILRKWTFLTGKIALLLGALGVTYSVFSIVSLQLALKSRQVSVPSLSGLTTEQAMAVLADISLDIRVEPLRRIHQLIPPGHIAEQNPSAGLSTRKQRVVKVWLSSGPTPSSVPMLIGASESAAKRRLDENAFALATLSEIRSSQYPTDAVVAQYSSTERNGQTVSLLVNRGERGRTYVMPDLIGVNGSTIPETLRAQGFRVTIVGDHPYPGIQAGIVIRQSPPAGFQIAPGEPISLEVSR